MVNNGQEEKVFGPVPSRRLGRSLGINNIPPKICSYSCVYCQVGNTLNYAVEPQDFYDPETIYNRVRERAAAAARTGEEIDFLTFVPDGEPTLDKNLGREIELLKPLGIKIAVITNGSLISRADVRQALMKSDWVSLKVDAPAEELWRKTNRPHKSLQIEKIRKAMMEFRDTYWGELVTETMLVRNLNDGPENRSEVASFLNELQPSKAYVSIPTRPPALDRVKPALEHEVVAMHQEISRYIDDVEYLIGYEGNAFASTGDLENDLMSITAVHPMREEAVAELVKKSESDWSLVRALINSGKIVETEFDGQKYYARRFTRINPRNVR